MYRASQQGQDVRATREQLQQQARQDVQATRDQLREQIRQQVREQVRAAQEQAAMAREQAALAREQAATAREEARMAREQADMQASHSMPGHAVVHIPRTPPIPREAVDISLAFFATFALVILGLPLLRAFGRRLGTPVTAPVADPDVDARLTRIEQAVQAVAIEVERIGEGQRFTSHLFAKAGLSPRLESPSGSPRH